MTPEPLYAKIDENTSGDKTIITAQTGIRFAITHIFYKAAGIVNVKFLDGSTEVSGAIPEVANSGADIDMPGDKPLLLTAGNAFKINLSAAIQVSGFVVYFKYKD